MGDKVNVNNIQQEAYCNTKLGLGLALGVGEYAGELINHHERKEDTPLIHLNLSLSLSNVVDVLHHEDSSYNNLKTKVNDDDGDQHDEQYHGCNTDQKSDCYSNNKNFSTKKLRLSKQQSNLLEDIFKRQTTLNPVCVCVCVYLCLLKHLICLMLLIWKRDLVEEHNQILFSFFSFGWKTHNMILLHAFDSANHDLGPDHDHAPIFMFISVLNYL